MATWTTRPETTDDIPTIREINLAAFPAAQEADLVDALRADPHAWIDGLSMVTEAPDGTLVGHALLTRCHVDGQPALALAPCAVPPTHQSQGAGSAAIRAALDAARSMGENLVLVLGHIEYYPRFGFTPASRFGIRAPFEVPDEAMMARTTPARSRPAPSSTPPPSASDRERLTQAPVELPPPGPRSAPGTGDRRGEGVHAAAAGLPPLTEGTRSRGRRVRR